MPARVLFELEEFQCTHPFLVGLVISGNESCPVPIINAIDLKEQWIGIEFIILYIFDLSPQKKK